MAERWVGILGFDNYQVSSLGRICALGSGRILKVTRGTVDLFRDGRHARRSLRKILVEAFGIEHVATLVEFSTPPPEVVKQIRFLQAQGVPPATILAQTGKSRQYIHNIVNGKRWSKDPPS